RAESEHPPPRIGERKHDPPPEPIVEPALAPPLRQPRRRKLLRPEAVALRPQRNPVPRARRVPDAEVSQHLLPKSPPGEVVARPPRLLRPPQIALVIRRRALNQLQQPLAPAPPRFSLRILLLAPQLDPVSVREHLHRAPEVERL